MRKFALTTSFLLSLCHAFAFTGVYHVTPADVHDGYVIKRIPLEAYATPLVKISGITYTNDVALPANALPADPTMPELVMAKERKRAFAYVRIPAFKGDAATGKVSMISDFTLIVTEQPAAQPNKAAAKTTSASGSVLATGTWYKIGVTNTGLYKIDYSFLTKLGVSPAGINPANIRIYGNGGGMLPEANATPRINDLAENAIQVSHTGSSSAFEQQDYVLFYARGPMTWLKDSANQKFIHQKNIYSDTAYYFISFDKGAGMRIASQDVAPAANQTVTTFNDYAVNDSDAYNPTQLGRAWYGAQLSLKSGSPATRDYVFNFGSNVTALSGRVSAVSVSDAGGQMAVSLNGTQVTTMTAGGTNGNQLAAGFSAGTFTTSSGGQSADISVSYSSGNTDGAGYLDYIELNMRRGLAMSGTQMGFRDWQSTGAGNTAQYELAGATAATQVWDVTDPQNAILMKGATANGTFTFSQDAQMLHEFVAMNSTDLPSPSFAGAAANQDLHGTAQVDYIIVANPAYLDAASKLADWHRQTNNYKVVVATTTQVYNEFSSGAQDLSAIRDFARMFYDRAGNDTTQMPRYMLLFGGASYDYKNRLPNNSNYVPTYESVESFSNLLAYCGDDFLGFLDDNEDINSYSIFNTLDIAIGRLPARNAADAMAMVNKIMIYKSPASLGPWRIATSHVADDADGAGNHLDVANEMATDINAISNNLYNETKVYVDAIPKVSTPAGTRCPNANAAIDDHIYKGTFLINYNGHGNSGVWAGERILTEDDYNKWTNLYALPFMITATCEFGQYDHPDFVSAGEQMVVKNDGGAIASLTTTQQVYSSYNRDLNIQYLNAQFTRLGNGDWNTFGEAYRLGKNYTYQTTNSSGTLLNFRKFALLGDPGLTPDFPQYHIRLDGIIDGGTHQAVDSVNALGSYTLNGSVTDLNGTTLDNFNGNAYVTFYDKPRVVRTITSLNENFVVQDNIIYKGKATVVNGHFSLSFISPKDINYNYGNGKISTYAENGITDAAGADSSITVGGFSDHPVTSTTPPVVLPYMNDSLFVNGGVTGTNSVLYASLSSETGINVSGNVVGHDLIAMLDSNVANPYVMNDYYQTEPNTYKKGYVYFPVAGLADGRHTFTVRAWDVNNNMGEGKVDFAVVNGDVVTVQNLMNYPNPFRDVTHFVFEHNHPDEPLDIQINIYNAAGAFVRTIKKSFLPSGSRSVEVTWDGTDNHGLKLPSGVYVYRFNVATESGIQNTAYQKLVLVR